MSYRNNIKLSKTDKKNIRSAIYYAVEYHESLIDAYRVSLKRIKGRTERFIPTEYKKDTDRWKRQMAAWKKLKLKLNTI